MTTNLERPFYTLDENCEINLNKFKFLSFSKSNFFMRFYNEPIREGVSISLVCGNSNGGSYKHKQAELTISVVLYNCETV